MQFGSQRRGLRHATEPKAPAGRRDIDVNRERLIYVLTSLVGHRLTAKCRNNVSYEGIFHSCCLDGDYSITLRSARLVSSNGGSGEVIPTLVIPGKDFLQVSAFEVPPPKEKKKKMPPEQGLAYDLLPKRSPEDMDAFFREHRMKRGLITAHSASPSPVLAEMKGVNALNLEPALPKLDSQTRTDWIDFKKSRMRTTSKPGQEVALKHEFQLSLEIFKKRESLLIEKATVSACVPGTVNGSVQETADPVRESGEGLHHEPGLGKTESSDSPVALLAPNPGFQEPDLTKCVDQASTNTTSGDVAGSSFIFNPGAKEFSFNPGAATFTPTNVVVAGSAYAPIFHENTTSETGLKFIARRINPDFLQCPLGDLVEDFRARCDGENTTVSSPDWPLSNGPGIREVMGNRSAPNAMLTMPAGNAGCQGPIAWQPQSCVSPVGIGCGGSGCQVPNGCGFCGGCSPPPTPQHHAGCQCGAFIMPAPVSPNQQTGGMMQGGIAVPNFGQQMVQVMVPAGQFGSQGFVMPQQAPNTPGTPGAWGAQC